MEKEERRENEEGFEDVEDNAFLLMIIYSRILKLQRKMYPDKVSHSTFRAP